MLNKIHDAMRSEGLHPKSISIDNKFHRFSTNNKSSDEAGFYCFTELSNCIVGVFGDWRAGTSYKYCSKSESAMSNIERVQVQREIKAQELKKQREEKKNREAAALKAAEIMDSVDFNAEHEYIKRKQIVMLGGAGVRGVELCVPCYNKDMQLVNVERITLDNKKPLWGGERTGTFSLIGTPAEGETMLLTEGYATAASIHLATKKPVIVGFNAGNLPNVAVHFKNHPLIICADNDSNNIGLKKAQEAAKKHGNARVVLCPVSTDFNDMHVQQGLDAVREFIYPKREVVEREAGQVTGGSGEWYNDWVYINSHKKYYSLIDKQFYSSEAFNIKCTVLVPENEKMTASAYIAQYGLIKVIAQPVYAPNIKELFFKQEHKDCINTYDHQNELKPAVKFTSEGKKAINKILFHILTICNKNHEHYELMINWLAWQVQRRGEKILWSPLIQGIEGIGKSFIGLAARAMLGNNNVKTVSTTELASIYNAWAQGACLVIADEIRIAGHNRHDIINRLKPLITDPYIQISEKHVTAYNTTNVSNYFCTTNYKDAVPLTATDRRWWILFSEHETVADFLIAVGGDENYFPKLYDDLYKYADELLKFFMEYKISNDFINCKQAPITDFKRNMLKNEDAKVTGLDEARELLKQGGEYFTEKVVCSADFFEKLMQIVPDLELKSQNRAIFMQKLGYSMYKGMRIGDKIRKVWVKKDNMTDEEIRIELQNSTYL